MAMKIVIELEMNPYPEHPEIEFKYNILMEKELIPILKPDQIECLSEQMKEFLINAVEKP
jgi:hypothetical protein